MPAAAGAARPAAVAFILIAILLDVLAFGIVIPILPKLIEAFQHGDTARAAQTYSVFAGAWGLMQFVFSPLLGLLSDRFGRRPVLLLSLLGLGLDYIIMALAPDLTWLFIGRLISGITAATYSTAAAYIADVTPPEKRAQSYGYIGAAWAVGFIAGPAIGGLLGAIDLRLAFWVAAGLTLANAAYGWFVVPESLPPERREAPRWIRANPVGALALLRENPGLAGLVAMQVLYMLGHYSLPTVFVLYTSYRYGWGLREIGFVLTLVGVCSAIVQGGLVGPVVRWLGERRTALAGLLAGTLAFALYGLAPTGPWFLAGIPFGALMGLYGGAAQALMTGRVLASQQGQLQGVNSSVMGLCGVVGPVIFGFSFKHGIAAGGDGRALFPGAAFEVAALLTALAFVVAFGAARSRGAPAAAREAA